MSSPLSTNEQGAGTSKRCPTCRCDGSELRPFDGNCPATWAHIYLSSVDVVESQQGVIKELRAEVSQLQADVHMALDALREIGSGATYTVEAIAGEPVTDATTAPEEPEPYRHINVRPALWVGSSR